MSRNKKSNDILTPEKQVKVGRRVLRGPEPVALVGPEKNRDTISTGEFARQLFGPDYKVLIIPPEGQPILS